MSKTKESKTKHTPGPWNIAETELTGAPRVIHTGSQRGRTKDGYPAITGTAIAEIRNVEYRFRECKANGHLIAAAPEMLEALEALEQFHGLGVHGSTPQDLEIMIRKMKRAIAKAKGEVQDEI